MVTSSKFWALFVLFLTFLENANSSFIPHKIREYEEKYLRRIDNSIHLEDVSSHHFDNRHKRDAENEEMTVFSIMGKRVKNDVTEQGTPPVEIKEDVPTTKKAKKMHTRTRLSKDKMVLDENSYNMFKNVFELIVKNVGDGIMEFLNLLHCTEGLLDKFMEDGVAASSSRGFAVKVSNLTKNIIVTLPSKEYEKKVLGLVIPIGVFDEEYVGFNCSVAKSEMKDRFIYDMYEALLESKLLVKMTKKYSMKPDRVHSHMDKMDEVNVTDFKYRGMKILLTKGTTLLLQIDPESKKVIMKPGLIKIRLKESSKHPTFEIRNSVQVAELKKLHEILREGVEFIKHKNSNVEYFLGKVGGDTDLNTEITKSGAEKVTENNNVEEDVTENVMEKLTTMEDEQVVTETIMAEEEVITEYLVPEEPTSEYVTNQEGESQYLMNRNSEVEEHSAEEESVTAQNMKTEELLTEMITAEYIKSEVPSTEEAPTESTESEKHKREEVTQEYMTPEELTTKYMESEKPKREEVTQKYMTPEGSTTKYMVSEKPKREEVTQKYMTPEGPTTKYMESEKPNREEVTQKYMTPEEPTTRYMESEEPKREEVTQEYMTSEEPTTEYMGSEITTDKKEMSTEYSKPEEVMLLNDKNETYEKLGPKEDTLEDVTTATSDLPANEDQPLKVSDAEYGINMLENNNPQENSNDVSAYSYEIEKTPSFNDESDAKVAEENIPTTTEYEVTEEESSTLSSTTNDDFTTRSSSTGAFDSEFSTDVMSSFGYAKRNHKNTESTPVITTTEEDYISTPTTEGTFADEFKDNVVSSFGYKKSEKSSTSEIANFPSTESVLPSTTYNTVPIKVVDVPEDGELYPHVMLTDSMSNKVFKASFDRILKYTAEAVMDFHHFLHCADLMNLPFIRRGRALKPRRNVAVKVTNETNNIIISLPSKDATTKVVGVVMPQKVFSKPLKNLICDTSKTDMKDRFIFDVHSALVNSVSFVEKVQRFSSRPNLLSGLQPDVALPKFDYDNMKILIAQGEDLLMQIDPQMKQVILKPGLIEVNMTRKRQQSTFSIQSASQLSNIRKIKDIIVYGTEFIRMKNPMIQQSYLIESGPKQDSLYGKSIVPTSRSTEDVTTTEQETVMDATTKPMNEDTLVHQFSQPPGSKLSQEQYAKFLLEYEKHLINYMEENNITVDMPEEYSQTIESLYEQYEKTYEKEHLNETTGAPTKSIMEGMEITTETSQDSGFEKVIEISEEDITDRTKEDENFVEVAEEATLVNLGNKKLNSGPFIVVSNKPEQETVKEEASPKPPKKKDNLTTAPEKIGGTYTILITKPLKMKLPTATSSTDKFQSIPNRPFTQYPAIFNRPKIPSAPRPKIPRPTYVQVRLTPLQVALGYLRNRFAGGIIG